VIPLTWYLALLLLLTGLAWYPFCKPSVGSPCNVCSGNKPTTIQLILAGAADGGGGGGCADCNEKLNGTHILIETGATWPCQLFKGPAALNCGDPDSSTSYFLRADISKNSLYSTANAHWFVTVSAHHVVSLIDYSSVAYFVYDSGSTTTLDCMVDRSLTRFTPSPAPAPDNSCDFSSLTASLDIP